MATIEEPRIAARDEKFRDRRDAGTRLAPLLGRYARERPVVVAIPRGGVPVAAEVARSIAAPLDVIVVRKLGAPENPEYGIGAVAEGGGPLVSRAALARLHIGAPQLTELAGKAQEEMRALTGRLRAGRPPIDVRARTAILVDDGLATGRTAHAAALALRRRGAQRVVLAVPVAARASIEELGESVDELVCARLPEELWAIGFWYEDFAPTSEEDVLALLEQGHHGGDRGGAGDPGGADGER